MCHYVSYCVPVTHMLINADLCLIMLIYNRATGVLLTDCRKKKNRVGYIQRHDVSNSLPLCFQDEALKRILLLHFFWGGL